MTNQNNNPKRTRNIANVCETVAGIEPAAAQYIIMKKDIIDFTTDFLEKSNIDARGVGIEAVRTGNVNPLLEMSVFFTSNSRDLIGNNFDISRSMIPNKIKTSGMALSDNLNRALSVIGKNGSYLKRTSKPDLYHVEIEPLTIIALMLGVDRKIHDCVINSVSDESRRGLLVSALKSQKRGRRNKRRQNSDLMNYIK